MLDICGVEGAGVGIVVANFAGEVLAASEVERKHGVFGSDAGALDFSELHDGLRKDVPVRHDGMEVLELSFASLGGGDADGIGVGDDGFHLLFQGRRGGCLLPGVKELRHAVGLLVVHKA